MTGPRCHEKKHITTTIEYSSPTAWLAAGACGLGYAL